jgi:hypothetical protein
LAAKFAFGNDWNQRKTFVSDCQFKWKWLKSAKNLCKWLSI